jgi:hypothetical protein
MNAPKLLTGLIFASALFSSAAFAEDTLKVSQQNGKQRIDFTMHGKTCCVLVGEQIYCVPAKLGAPIKLASSTD